MAKKKKTRRDTAEIARSIVEQVIGEKLNGEPLDEAEDSNVHVNTDVVSAESGRRGGLKGGRARAKKLSAKERSRIAKKAAAARWASDKDSA